MAYDPSTDYARYPTLAPLPARMHAGCADCLFCPGCGGETFCLRRTDRKPVCTRCGQPLEEQPASKAATAAAPVARKAVRPRIQLSTCFNSPFFLCFDGRVKAYSYNARNHPYNVHGGKYSPCKVDSWYPITAVAAGSHYTVGLRADETVLAVGDNACGQCNVQNWSEITAIAAGIKHTVGLRTDGTVLAVGDNNCGQCHVQDWTDIVQIAASMFFTVGLRADGTVVIAGAKSGFDNIQSWSNIVSISASFENIYGLRTDGTVVAAGINDCGQCNIQGWTDIQAISVSPGRIAGLRRNGTVLFAGDDVQNSERISGWRNITSIQVFGDCVAATESDGTFHCTNPEIYTLLIKELPPECR